MPGPCNSRGKKIKIQTTHEMPQETIKIQKFGNTTLRNLLGKQGTWGVPIWQHKWKKNKSDIKSLPKGRHAWLTAPPSPPERTLGQWLITLQHCMVTALREEWVFLQMARRVSTGCQLRVCTLPTGAGAPRGTSITAPVTTGLGSSTAARAGPAKLVPHALGKNDSFS